MRPEQRSYSPNARSGMPLGCYLQIAMVLFVLFVGGAVTWIQASMEAKTYNKLTGANVTAWDALWVQLRVDGDN